jgi:hypothetical protein
VQFGLTTDKKLCAEPQRIIDRFAPEFEKLVLSLCMLPWDQPVDADEAPHWLFTTMPGPQPQRRRSAPRRSRKPARRPASATAGARGNGGEMTFRQPANSQAGESLTAAPAAAGRPTAADNAGSAASPQP